MLATGVSLKMASKFDWSFVRRHKRRKRVKMMPFADELLKIKCKLDFGHLVREDYQNLHRLQGFFCSGFQPAKVAPVLL